MSRGAGRGRGWLNLAKNSEPPKPLGLCPQPVVSSPPNAPQDPSEYSELIEKISEISEADDGIAFNQKIRQIRTTWIESCTCKEEVEESFASLYKTCLHDTEFASKFVSVIAAHSRLTTQVHIHDCSLRKEFLTLLQKDFEIIEQLQATDPSSFRNCIHMVGEYFRKARFPGGDPYKVLIPPLISGLEMLLESKLIPNLALYAKQLFLSGADLKKYARDDVMKLSIKTRTMLAEESQLVKEARVWVMLALELFNNRFGVFAPEEYMFYEEQLGSTVMINFQKPHDILSIETVHSSKVLDSYQSNVNVLQISTSPTKPPNETQNRHLNNSEPLNNSLGSSKSKEKTGRPILGAGARSNKSKSDESNGTWNNKTASGRLSKKSPNLKNNKGWEHDDRFDNDYN